MFVCFAKQKPGRARQKFLATTYNFCSLSMCKFVIFAGAWAITSVAIQSNSFCYVRMVQKPCDAVRRVPCSSKKPLERRRRRRLPLLLPPLLPKLVANIGRKRRQLPAILRSERAFIIHYTSPTRSAINFRPLNLKSWGKLKRYQFVDMIKLSFSVLEPIVNRILPLPTMYHLPKERISSAI